MPNTPREVLEHWKLTLPKGYRDAQGNLISHDPDADIPINERSYYLPARLKKIFDSAVFIKKRGVAFILPDDLMRNAILKASVNRKFFGVYVHGNEQLAGYAGRPLIPNDLGMLIWATPTWGGRVIELQSCYSGKGKIPFAEHLSRVINQDVWAPTEAIFIKPINTKRNIIINTSVKYVNGNPKPEDPTDGKWRLFHPQKLTGS